MAIPDKNKKSRKKLSTSHAAFYIVTLLAGIVVCIVLFIVTYQTMSENNPVTTGTVRPTNSPVISTLRDLDDAMGVIVKTDAAAGAVTLMDLESGRETSYILLDTTEMTSRWGTLMSFAEFERGLIVEIKFEKSTMELISLSVSAQAWEHQFIRNVTVNTESGTLSFGNNTYRYTNSTIVLYNGQPYGIGLIGPLDTLSIVGFRDTAWRVTLESSFGYIQVNNCDLVINGTLAAGSSVFKTLVEAEPIPMAEGLHKIIIEGNNINPYIADVFVRQGETSHINLADVEYRLAALYVAVNEPGSAVVIDGVAQSGSGPYMVEFGDRTVRVEAPGFIPAEQKINVQKPRVDLSFNLQPEEKSGFMTINTRPAGAEIYFNNTFMGYSPLTRFVVYGNFNVIARMPGYTDTQINVDVNENANIFLMILVQDTGDGFGPLPPPDDGLEPLD
ncbi:MAG: PEGA domain-containing protein [Defluviitaleaceae bacterium]|nr:PEGA domain-containing protein [Defluviitaleaceae bacterium]